MPQFNHNFTSRNLPISVDTSASVIGVAYFSVKGFDAFNISALASESNIGCRTPSGNLNTKGATWHL